MQIQIEEEPITLVNLYAPTQSEGASQAEFMTKLNSELQDLEISDLFIGGDFNIQIPNSHTEYNDTSRGTSNRTIYVHQIMDVLSQYELSDA